MGAIFAPQRRYWREYEEDGENASVGWNDFDKLG